MKTDDFVPNLELKMALENPKYSLILKTTLRRLLQRIDCDKLLVYVNDGFGNPRLAETGNFSDPYIDRKFVNTSEYLKFFELKRECEAYKYFGVGGRISLDFFLDRVTFVQEHSNYRFRDTLADTTSLFNTSTFVRWK